MPVGDKRVPVAVFGTEEELWRQRVGALTVVPALLRQLGTDSAEVLAAAGLDGSALEDPDNTISYATFGRLLDEGAQRSGCEYFGLLVGQAWHLSTMGLVGRLIAHSSTVGEGLRLGVVYHHLNSHGGVVYLRERGAIAEFGYAIYHSGVQGAAQIYDGVLSALVNYMRELCGASWIPSEVLVAHAAPADASSYRRLFRSPVRFNSELNALRFDADWLKRTIAGADARVLRELEKRASSMTQPDLIEKLRRSLRVFLLSGITSGDAIADVLAIHRRTLNRRLKAQGTTFREVLEDVRFEAACQLLDATQLTLDDIAAALGYAGVSPFTRAFRRRSGAAPGKWRQVTKAGHRDQIEMRTPPGSIRSSAQ